MGDFLSISQIVSSLNKENIIRSANLIIKKFDDIYPLSFNIIISQIVYSFFVARMNSSVIYLSLLNEIEKFEENKNFNSKIIDVFLHFLKSEGTQESYYLVKDMIENNFIEQKIVKTMNYPLFAHYMSYQEIENIKQKHFTQEIIENYEALSKNDWELHKQLIKEGHNPNEIAKIIRNDEIEKLQEISTQTNFDFDQKIEQSLYERCSYINQEDVSLIDYAAFFGSIKCFKYLLMNGSDIENTGKYAVAGGNIEIVHLCEQNHSTFEQNNSSFGDAYEIAIKYYKNDIFKYLYENKIIQVNNLEELGKKCVLYHNYEILSYLLGEGMKINDDIINESARIGNLYLVKYFLKEFLPPESILVFSSVSENIELINLLLKHKRIEINAKDIYSFCLNFYIINLMFSNDIWKLFKIFNTVHMYASYNGQLEIFKLLLKQEGIEINAKDICSFCLNFILLI